MRHLRYLWLAGLMLCSTQLHAEPLDMQQAVELALAHAPAMQAAEAGRDAAAEDEAIGRAWLLPYVEVSGSLQRRRRNTAYDIPQTVFKTDLNYNENTIGVKVVQTLFDLGRWAGYRQGELSAEAGELKLQLERQRLILETTRAFLDAGTAGATLAAARAREAAAGKLAAQVTAAERVGTAAMPERLDAEARRDQARAERLQAENEMNQARAVLASLTGRAVHELQLPQIAPDPVNGAALKPGLWEEKAAGDALAVKLAEVQFGVAEQGKRKALSGALPRLQAFGEASRDRSSDSILNRGATVRDQAVGVQVSMPLYAGGGTTAQMRKSEKEALQAEFSLADDVRLARLSARQALLARQSATARYSAMTLAVASARKATEAAHRGYEVGLRSITEVLDADERSFAAERNRAAAVAQLVFAELQLRASVGELVGRPLPRSYGGEL